MHKRSLLSEQPTYFPKARRRASNVTNTIFTKIRNFVIKASQRAMTSVYRRIKYCSLIAPVEESGLENTLKVSDCYA